MTIRSISFALAALALVGFSAPAIQAQDAATAPLPEICTSAMAHNMGGGGMMMSGADQAHQDLMAGMQDMNTKMSQSAMVSDIDVAFVCSMIPHHQGAISMARAELEHGDNQWAKDTAQKIIDAQEKEIAEILAWLEEQAQQ